jgi:signal transduction histidine kinase
MEAIVDPSRAAGSACAPSPSRPSPHVGLFSALSREMCRPLISIRAGFDLLLAGTEGELGPKQAENLQGLRGQCDALIGLTRSFLDFAATTHLDRPLDLAAFRLGALLAEADRQFAHRAGARGIGWSCGLAGADVRVTTDLASFQEALGRLVSNALEQTDPGGRVAVLGRVEPGGWSVEVADDGRGIPAEALDRIFEPLTRLDGAPTSVARCGHGMGLAICRGLLDRLGGTIAIRSEPGRGTAVVVRFSE